MSPDNAWITFASERSGRFEVWIAKFPSGESPRQISTGGGWLPQWSANGREIVYVSEDKHLMTVPFQEGSTGSPQPLFGLPNLIGLDYVVVPTVNAYAAMASGERVLVAERARDPNTPPIRIVVNWQALLKP